MGYRGGSAIHLVAGGSGAFTIKIDNGGQLGELQQGIKFDPVFAMD
jgi:hypothetical protein